MTKERKWDYYICYVCHLAVTRKQKKRKHATDNRNKRNYDKNLMHLRTNLFFIADIFNYYER